MRFIHVVAYNIAVICLHYYIAIHCSNLPKFFLISSIGHLDCYHLRAILSNTAVNILLCVFFTWSPLRLTSLISLLSMTFRNLLQHYSSKASIVWHSAFFVAQLSRPYMTTGKTISLTIQTFVGRVMFLIFNILSRFVIAFLPRSNRLLISWLQSLSAVILELKMRKSVTTSTFSPSICHEVMVPDAMILIFSFLHIQV